MSNGYTPPQGSLAALLGEAAHQLVQHAAPRRQTPADRTYPSPLYPATLQALVDHNVGADRGWHEGAPPFMHTGNRGDRLGRNPNFPPGWFTAALRKA